MCIPIDIYKYIKLNIKTINLLFFVKTYLFVIYPILLISLYIVPLS